MVSSLVLVGSDVVVGPVLELVGSVAFVVGEVGLDVADMLEALVAIVPSEPSVPTSSEPPEGLKQLPRSAKPMCSG